MPTTRIAHAVDTGALSVPPSARIALLEPSAQAYIPAFATQDIVVQQTFKPDFDACQAMGLTVADHVADAVDYAHVTVPRSRDLARGLIAQAEKLARGGVVLVDGAKTDGIDALLKSVRARVDLSGQIAKAHGKLFWFPASDAFADWALPDPAPVADGWFTQPGVFSADGPDAGSQALLAALPSDLKGHGADLGAGWGFLSKHLLQRSGVTQVDVVEADKRALDCAGLNITDPRAQFHWADATTWGTPGSLDWVVTNPPFHTSRTPDARLGQAFIRSAARLLKPKGQLIMVANRHLPYETTLAECFGAVQELDGDSRFKVLRADHPKSSKPTTRVRRR